MKKSKKKCLPILLNGLIYVYYISLGNELPISYSNLVSCFGNHRMIRSKLFIAYQSCLKEEIRICFSTKFEPTFFPVKVRKPKK